jgi:hypothetical protein
MATEMDPTLSAVLLAAVYREEGREVALVYLMVVTAFVGLFLVSQSTLAGLAGTTAVLTGVALLAGYTLHRYELVALELVEEAER